jgi:hypothetical protein
MAVVAVLVVIDFKTPTPPKFIKSKDFLLILPVI